MIFEQLDELTHLSGILSLITVGIVFFASGNILYKAYKTKEKILYFFLLTYIFSISPWYSSSFGYLIWLFTGYFLNYEIYVLVGTIFIPIAMFSWLEIYMITLFPNQKKIVLILFAIFSLIFYIYLLYYLIFAPSAPIMDMIGAKTGILDISYKGFILIYLGATLFQTFITGLHFSIISMKRKDDPTLHWKGRFLLIAFSAFFFSGLADGILELNLMSLIVSRIMTLISTAFFYVGFIMPKWACKFLKIAQVERERLENFSKMFTKPEKITEEEVTFYRERKICLVCKGKVGGFNNFICTKCDALYCTKCAKALSNLENMCWVCSAPFDESKPMTPRDELLEDISVKDDQKKDKTLKKNTPKKNNMF